MAEIRLRITDCELRITDGKIFISKVNEKWTIELKFNDPFYKYFQSVIR